MVLQSAFLRFGQVARASLALFLLSFLWICSAQSVDFPTKSAALVKPKMGAAEWAQVGAYAGLAVADWHSTNRAIARKPWARGEGNPLLACGEPGEIKRLCAGRYIALNVGVTAGLFAINRYITPKLPRRSRRVFGAMTWAMLGWRGGVVVRNYR